MQQRKTAPANYFRAFMFCISSTICVFWANGYPAINRTRLESLDRTRLERLGRTRSERRDYVLRSVSIVVNWVSHFSRLMEIFDDDTPALITFWPS